MRGGKAQPGPGPLGPGAERGLGGAVRGKEAVFRLLPGEGSALCAAGAEREPGGGGQGGRCVFR